MIHFIFALGIVIQYSPPPSPYPPPSPNVLSPPSPSPPPPPPSPLPPSPFPPPPPLPSPPPPISPPPYMHFQSKLALSDCTSVEPEQIGSYTYDLVDNAYYGYNERYNRSAIIKSTAYVYYDCTADFSVKLYRNPTEEMQLTLMVKRNNEWVEFAQRGNILFEYSPPSPSPPPPSPIILRRLEDSRRRTQEQETDTFNFDLGNTNEISIVRTCLSNNGKGCVDDCGTIDTVDTFIACPSNPSPQNTIVEIVVWWNFLWGILAVLGLLILASILRMIAYRYRKKDDTIRPPPKKVIIRK